MKNLRLLYEQWAHEEAIISIVLSNVKKGAEKTFKKVDVKPVLLKNELMYHFSYYYEQKVIHENVTVDELVNKLEELAGPYFKQMVVFATDHDHHMLFNKKGEGTHLQKAPTKFKTSFEHNRQKHYLLEEGTPCDFLIELGVMDEEGKVFKKRYDKFKQLNKYLEFVEDAIKVMKPENKVRIIDFGCGKAYLTFALYYYLVVKKGLEVEITGLDLKSDVITYCNGVAEKLNYKGLRFELGDIKDYEDQGHVDMVVSLHACDTATDEAIAKAVKWQAKVIFAVPCCQHELFNQIKHQDLEPLLRYGVVKDKFATIVTDTLRMTALEVMDYDTQLLEFIDLEHTPKNILIRAYHNVKPLEDQQISARSYTRYRDAMSVKPHIEKALGSEFKARLDQ